MPPVPRNIFGIQMFTAFSQGNLWVTAVWDPVFIWLLHICTRAPALAETKFNNCWVLLWRSSCLKYSPGSVTFYVCQEISWLLLLSNQHFENWRVFFFFWKCSAPCAAWSPSPSTSGSFLSLLVSVLLILLAESCAAFSPSLLTLIKCSLSLCC